MDEDGEIEQFRKFMKAAVMAVKASDEAVFICPVCGGRARSERAVNGQIHAICKGCRINVMGEPFVNDSGWICE